MNPLYSTPTPEKREFNALYTLSNVFWVFGWLLLVVAVMAVIFTFDVQPGIGILVGIGIAFLGLLAFAAGELIKVLLKIEKNTRKG